MKERLLLHSCCGPCSTSVIERLIPTYKITLFYYNPCITDREEYEKRKANQIRFLILRNERAASEEDLVEFAEGTYEPEAYLSAVRGYENEPEGGLRCTICFRQRLSKAAEYASRHGFPIYTTTLTVSSHKDYKRITAIGEEIAFLYEGLQYLDMDFKKKDGFKRSVELSKEYGLYRQNFCGCEFSRRR
ncbi:MAG: epoxyqueuosine reductase QueH [Eubacteriales bacterium]|nr:epoxyqueuosine reductase QueH [Eubacteriales bacterium]